MPPGMHTGDGVIFLSSLIKIDTPLPTLELLLLGINRLTLKINCLDLICSIWGSHPLANDTF